MRETGVSGGARMGSVLLLRTLASTIKSERASLQLAYSEGWIDTDARERSRTSASGEGRGVGGTCQPHISRVGAAPPY